MRKLVKPWVNPDRETFEMRLSGAFAQLKCG